MLATMRVVERLPLVLVLTVAAIPGLSGCASGRPPVEQGSFHTPDLVELAFLDPTIHLDIRYATADNIWSPNAYHNLQVTFNFNPGAQNFTVTLDGVLQSLTPSGGTGTVTTVPFRNTGRVSIAEQGFQATFNTQTMLPASNNAFFDNYVVTASPVPEPASILLLCSGAAAAGWGWRRRKLA